MEISLTTFVRFPMRSTPVALLLLMIVSLQGTESLGQGTMAAPGLGSSPQPAAVQTREIRPGERCSECTRPAETRPLTRWDLSGFWGRPYVEPPVGGCECGTCRGVTRQPEKSVYWPRPWSGHLENRTPRFNSFLENCFAPALTAPFDGLGGFKGLPYQRRDSGYAGCGRDPYGCLGESNQPGNCR